MKPNFESPVHTARDILERDITVYMGISDHIWKQWLSQSDIPEYRKIAESTMILKTSKNGDIHRAMTRNELLSQGTHAQLRSYMEPNELAWTTEYDHYQENYKYNRGRGYYRGEMLDGKIPGGGYLTNKKWHLNEVCLLLVALTEFQIYVCQMF